MSDDKHRFISNYVSTFLAAFNASRYEDACFHGFQERLTNPKTQPVEDAAHMAEQAWLGYVEWVLKPESDRKAKLIDTILREGQSDE